MDALLALAEAVPLRDEEPPPPVARRPAVVPGVTVARPMTERERRHYERRRSAAVGMDELTPWLIVVYLLLQVGSAIYLSLNLGDVLSRYGWSGPEPSAASVVWGPLFVQLVLFFSVVCTLVWFGVWIAGQVMDFPLPDGAYLRAAGVATLPGVVMGMAGLCHVTNLVVLLVTLLGIVPLMWFVLTQVFGLRAVEGLVSFLFAAILATMGAVPAGLIVRAAVWYAVHDPARIAAANLATAAPRVRDVEESRAADAERELSRAPKVEDVPLKDLPTISAVGATRADEVLDREAWVGHFMLRPPKGMQLKHRADTGRGSATWEGPATDVEVRGMSGHTISVPSSRLSVSVAAAEETPFKTVEGLLTESERLGLRVKQGRVGEWPFVATHRIDGHYATPEYTTTYRVFAGPLVLTIEAAAREPFDGGVHAQMAAALATLQPLDLVHQALADLRSDDAGAQPSAMERLAAAPPDARREEVLREAAAATSRTGPGEGRLRVAAVRVIAAWAADERQWAPIREALADEDRSVRAAAVEALAARKDPSAIGPIVRLLPRDGAMLGPALKAYGPSMAKEIVEQIAALLAEDKGALAARAAVEGLAAVGMPEGLPLVRQLARHEDDAAAKAARALWRKLAPGELDDVGELLLDLDGNGSNWIRQNRVLETLARTPADEARRERVAEALEKLVVEGTIHTRRAATAALLKWAGKKTPQRMVQLLGENGDADKRHAAMEVLGELKDPATVYPVCRWLVLDPFAAADALKKMGTVAEDEVLKLLPVNKAPTMTRRYVCEILGVIGTQKSVAPLTQASRDRRDRIVQEAAAKALEAVKVRVGNRE